VAKSIGILLITKQSTILFGRERSGIYNVIGGKGEPIDYVNGLFCWYETAVRETVEEIKLDLRSNEVFNTIFTDENGVTRITLVGRTPVLVGILPEGLISFLKQAIAVRDPLVPSCEREIDDIQVFDPNGEQFTLSPYAIKAINRVKLIYPQLLQKN
jgi:8-oxo-dGTP pyrophosphatase MutT (NUDIX family)